MEPHTPSSAIVGIPSSFAIEDLATTSPDYPMDEPDSDTSFSSEDRSDDTEASLYSNAIARPSDWLGQDTSSIEALHYPPSWSHRELANCKLKDDWLFAATGPFGYATTVSESRGPNGEVVYTLDHTDFMKKIEKEPRSMYKVQFSRCSKLNTWLLGLDETRVGMIRREHVAKRIARYEVAVQRSGPGVTGARPMDPIFQNGVFELAWPAAWDAISREYENVWMSAGASGEARARMLISPVLGELARLSGWRLLNYTEHTLSEDFTRKAEEGLDERVTDEAKTLLSNPTRIDHLLGELELTGKIDYLLYGSEEKLTEAQMRQLRPLKTLNETLAELKLHYNQDISILLVEAKAEGEHGKRAQFPENMLSEHIPQIVMEAYVVSTKSKRAAIPWVLTDGLNWIFGVLQIGLNGESNRFGHFMVKPIDLNGASESNRESMATIFRLLTYWAFGDPGHLYVQFIRRKWVDRVRDRGYEDISEWPTLPIKLVIPLDVDIPPRFTQQEYTELWGDEAPAA